MVPKCGGSVCQVWVLGPTGQGVEFDSEEDEDDHVGRPSNEVGR
jgi:hypothetical protein